MKAYGWAIIFIIIVSIASVAPVLFMDNTNSYSVNKTNDRYTQLINHVFNIMPKQNNAFCSYNFLFHAMGGPQYASSFIAYLFAYLISENRTYLTLASNMLENAYQHKIFVPPMYIGVFMKYHPSARTYLMYYAKQLLNELKNTPLPMIDKIMRLPWNVYPRFVANLLVVYKLTLDKTYLNAVLHLLDNIFRFLRNNETGLLADGYIVNHGQIIILEPFQRVYSIALTINSLIAVYLLTGNQTIKDRLIHYVNAVQKYVWGGDHWYYRTNYDGTPKAPYQETHFHKLDYALYLYMHYIQWNETIWHRIQKDINYALDNLAHDFIFRHGEGDNEYLFYAQLNSLIYMLKILNKQQWYEKHINATLSLFLLDKGYVAAIQEKYVPLFGYTGDYIASAYGPQLQIDFTAHIFTIVLSQKLGAIYPIPLTYSPHIGIIGGLL